jgi:hypothetical protein
MAVSSDKCSKLNEPLVQLELHTNKADNRNEQNDSHNKGIFIEMNEQQLDEFLETLVLIENVSELESL